MPRRRRLPDVEQILELRRLRAAEALSRYQEADQDERARIEAEREALCRVQAAAAEWQSYLAAGSIRPDFIGALAQAISAADERAEAAARSRIDAAARREAARLSFGAAQSVEDGARREVRKLGRKEQQRRDDSRQAGLEESAAQRMRRP